MTGIQPELWVDRPAEAVAFYGAAFGARVLHQVGEGDDIVAQLAVGDDSLQVLTDAIDQLARLRTPYWLGDSAVHLHALASLIAQAQQLLPQAVHDARDQELTWAQSASSSTPPPPPPHAATGTNHDQLDNDHRHNAEMSISSARKSMHKIEYSSTISRRSRQSSAFSIVLVGNRILMPSMRF